ncbi:MAG: PorP/SprF family type IX secretion system membrane protein [Saprospiraceae bacterium]|nr:PorP/SprF family type IX secretion system membrane protein [Saprospiraceae bacterium]MCF8249545.1 PorP/SprF family type IX secretion system membrane protein [Saprospiraceae bacterium]MCF8281295.1 PorP/SprF family type IX secretion system membrane protein [Bacteroidales bacterium]MCF8310763.1 PorP/SprF family type IX secretion system membrane protein [Saprospiraceae bacterium]MCF8439406.1 PorP/SprF family type IX secretion system membrane protein [Saprospiraceae bacterium]
MRLTKTILLLVVTLGGFGHLKSQDLHNTLFYMNPLHMNPAFSGAYEGTFRIGGLYRDQARTAIGKSAYSTPTIFVDAPILMIGKRHWIGVGLLVFQDAAGDGKLTTSAGQLSGAFHLALDKKSKNVVTLGVQWGKVGRKIKSLNGLLPEDLLSQQLANMPGAATTDLIFQSGGSTPGPGNNSDKKKDFTDINLGLLFKSKASKTTDYNFGVSARHITTPGTDYNFGGSNVDLNMRLIAHAQLNTALNAKWTLTPEVYFSNISPAQQFQVHAWAGYWLKPAENIKLNGGLGYRVGDSAQLLLGLDYKDFKVQLGYDFTLSALSEANSHQGGFEIAAYYTGKIYKKPDVKPVILCPHL